MRDLREKLGIPRHVSLFVATHTPGDGRRRYRFFLEPTHYSAGDGIATVLGRREAIAFVRGFLAGYSAETQSQNGRESRALRSYYELTACNLTQIPKTRLPIGEQ